MLKFLLFLLFVLGTAFALQTVIRRVVIFEFEKGLKYVEGRFKETLPSGGYWYLPFFTTIRKIDMRPKFVSISGQEVLSADSITLKVSLAAKYQIVDPQTAINAVENYEQALHLELQLGLREIISAAPIDEILETRSQLAPRLMELKKPRIAELGLTLLSVDVKDVMFPGDLKKIFAQTVKARKEGQAALEKARAETASLRHLANAAKLMDRSPHLMQLRALQTMGDSPGNTLVFGLPAQETVVPIKTHQGGEKAKRQTPKEEKAEE